MCCDAIKGAILVACVAMAYGLRPVENAKTLLPVRVSCSALLLHKMPHGRAVLGKFCIVGRIENLSRFRGAQCIGEGKQTKNGKREPTFDSRSADSTLAAAVRNPNRRTTIRCIYIPKNSVGGTDTSHGSIYQTQKRRQRHSFCLPACLSECLSICLCLCLSVCLPLCLAVSICPTVSLSLDEGAAANA